MKNYLILKLIVNIFPINNFIPLKIEEMKKIIDITKLNTITSNQVFPLLLYCYLYNSGFYNDFFFINWMKI